MAKIFKTSLSTNAVQAFHPEPVELSLSSDPGLFVGDDVGLISADGDTFIAEVADIEEERGKIYLELR
jgi:hypothetical protein